MDVQELMETGLTNNQASVYLEILKHPGQTAGEISKILSIDRSFVYSIITSLVDKGLVNHIVKAQKRIYFSSDPENLLKDLDEKRNKINSVVEKLKLLKEKNRDEISVNVYEGKSGLKAYIRDFLDCDSFETFGGGSNLKILEVLKYDYPHYLKEFNAKKIKGKLITSPKNKKTMNDIYKNSNVEIKIFEDLQSEINFTIFENKMAIYSTEEKPFVIIIQNEKISKALRTFFNKTWNLAK